MTSVFNIPVERMPKKEEIHPWAKSIKDHYANMIKRAHNSVKNVVYPEPKDKVPHLKRVTFTVIGDRVSKGFIYCVKLVQGMHRYRWKYYGAPIIRGCTTVEWGNIWQDLKLRFGSIMAHCISSPVIVLCNNIFLGGETELRETIESQYIYHLVLNYQKESVTFFMNYIKSSGRQCACMHISIEGEHIGCLIFMLYTDICPETSENFLRLCKTRRGGYSGTPVHRVVQDGWIQCGGYGLKNNENMDCENFIVPHDKRGVLGMANDGRHLDCSTQFYVLLQPNDALKNRFVAFGQLIDGEETLKKIEKVETFYEAPIVDITIYKAEVLNLDCKDIIINKSALEYLDGHIDDLVTIGEYFYELLMARLDLEIEFKELQALKSPEGESGEDYDEAFQATVNDDGKYNEKNILATRRYIRKKSEKKTKEKKLDPIDEKEDDVFNSNENNDFDVESYQYKGEEISTKESLDTSTRLVKPTKPYFIPFTDVPYPDEVDSNFDLKRLLQGDYCLEVDLNPDQGKVRGKNLEEKINALSQIISSYCSMRSEDSFSIESMSSDEERDLEEYLRIHGDKVSFAGIETRKIAKLHMKTNPLDQIKSTEQFNDEDLRMMRMALTDLRTRLTKGMKTAWETWRSFPEVNSAFEEMTSMPNEISEDSLLLIERKVSLKTRPWRTSKQVKRQPTGFVSDSDIAEIRVFERENEPIDELDEVDDKNVGRKVSITTDGPARIARKIHRRQTGYYRDNFTEDDEDDDSVKIDDGKRVGEEEKEAARKVSITTDGPARIARKIHRRQTGYYRDNFTEDDEDDDSVKIDDGKRVGEEEKEAASTKETVVEKKTGLEKNKEKHTKKSLMWIPTQENIIEKDSSSRRFSPLMSTARQSTLIRLYHDVSIDEDDIPTFKDYKPFEVSKKPDYKLAMSDSDIKENTILHRPSQRLVTLRQASDDAVQDKIVKHAVIKSVSVTDNRSVLKRNLQGTSLLAIRRGVVNRRPTMTVTEYQRMNDSKLAELKGLEF